MTASPYLLKLEDSGHFLHHPATQEWLAQFHPIDQPMVTELLEAILLVGRDAFSDGLRKLVKERISAGIGHVGLYAERELRKYKGVPNALFKSTRTKHKRAFGLGPAPVKSTKAYDPSVGSEGIVAQLITELCREDKRQVFNHPGPDVIRKYKIRRFFVLTDLIGTGNRARNYVESAWKVRSVRSWHAMKFLRIEVIAYAATSRGAARVCAHRSKPHVSMVSPCPTIDTTFSQIKRKYVKEICVRADPVGPDFVDSIGYCGQGALIAFGHGMPNNAPRMFYKSSARWTALFPERVTAEIASLFENLETAESIARRLRAMRQIRLAKSPWLNDAKPAMWKLMLVMAAVSNGPRSPTAIAERCKLKLFEAEALLTEALRLGWMNAVHRLTEAGHAQIAHAKTMGKGASQLAMLSFKDKSFYYPKQLRAPKL